jgi:hypothetical protein
MATREVPGSIGERQCGLSLGGVDIWELCAIVVDGRSTVVIRNRNRTAS